MGNLSMLLGKLETWLHRLEDWLLSLLLLGMILLACLQIFLRNVFDSGFVWADSLLSIILMWLGLLGALAASRYDKHIAIDVLARWPSAQLQFLIKIVTSVFAASVCLIVAFYAAGFVLEEYKYGTTAVAGWPAWWFELVIPLAFALMGLRYMIQVLQRLFILNRGAAG
jgi:TRAP-type C4-dicarboxylate transport system permease small subunit